MSVLLDEIIKNRRQKALNYAKYLRDIVELTKKVKNSSSDVSYPKSINTHAKKALYDNLGNNEELALKIDNNIRENKSDEWRGNRIKERQVEIAIRKSLEDSDITEENEIKKIFDLVKNQNEY